MELRSIMTFDKRILKLDGMSMDEQVFAEGSFRSGWLLGIDDKTDQLTYSDPASGETISVTLSGEHVMRDQSSAGGSGVPPVPTTPVPTTPVPTTPVPAAPVPAVPVPAAPLPTLAENFAAVPGPAVPAAVPGPTVPAVAAVSGPAVTAAAKLPSPGPTQIAPGIWLMPQNAVLIAPGIYRIP